MSEDEKQQIKCQIKANPDTDWASYIHQLVDTVDECRNKQTAVSRFVCYVSLLAPFIVWQVLPKATWALIRLCGFVMGSWFLVDKLLR